MCAKVIYKEIIQACHVATSITSTPLTLAVATTFSSECGKNEKFHLITGGSSSFLSLSLSRSLTHSVTDDT